MDKVSFAEKVLAFHKSLRITQKLPHGVGVMNPYQDMAAYQLFSLFFKKFYNDNSPRTLILGINPGRFGGGITGVPFTDPIKLESLGIANDLQKKPELSADFIYRMITAYGGPEKFYSRYYISAVSPLGFTQLGKNLNYYDMRELQESLTPFIVNSLKTQLDFGINTDVCYCLGEGQNFKFLTILNQEYRMFQTISPLPHPRFIMQYRRKRVDEYVEAYLKRLL